ncbi:MAG: sigma-54-dependent Fis family transcriptional regulator [Planctomycetes bacterium]|nr:sigma-54-dependent Fis family transcriptional regulator [Planctomycetota bacterium]
MATILIIEDEAALASALTRLVRRLECVPIAVASAELGLRRLQQEPVALVILDIGLPDRSGLDALLEIRASHPTLPVLVITAHGNLQNAIEARLRGASEYLVKPLDLAGLANTLRALLQVAANPDVSPPPAAEGDDARVLVGASAAMQPAFAAIAHAAASDVPVLLTGPTGTGKTFAARAIHQHSQRRQQPFVTLACGNLPENLLEAELFGHEKGAFTGAATTRPGHLERAAGGTLLLDEIGDAPLSVQLKLLRFLDDRSFTRVGGRTDLHVDLRIVAATNRDLARAAADGRFREDLLYRLRVLEVRMPALRERLGDLPALSSHLLRRLAPNRRLALASETMTALQAHDWPGNVRELRNALEHAAAVCGASVVLPAHLPAELRAMTPSASAPETQATLVAALQRFADEQLRRGARYDELHDALEQHLLAVLLPRFEGKPTLLARALDMNRATLRRKLRGTVEPEPDDDGEVPPGPSDLPAS